ncbi:MAG: YIP1 family protein [Anaerolineae bacterium]|nr:YIP1 family protein [Anaerolineae bacterium]
MATQVQGMSAPLIGNQQPSPGLISQIIALFTQPAAFFRHIPQKRQWVWVAVLILVTTGYAASSQSSQSSTVSDQTQGFDISLFQQDSLTRSSDQEQATALTTQTTSSEDTNTTLMSALLVACGVLATWTGQALLLSLVTMLRGYPPQVKRNFQIAVWASLPLALMLVLRQIYFAAGGTGGSMGLVLLLDQWQGYNDLPEIVQSVLAVFASNLSLFWIWSLVLLYMGARNTLNGKRWSVILTLAMWVTLSTVVTAFVSEPVTTVAPRTTTEVTTTQQSREDTSSSNDSTTNNFQQFGGNFSGGNFSGGEPPSGGIPGAGGPPGG